MSALALCTAAALGAIALALAVAERQIAAGARRRAPAARWASGRELGALRVTKPQPGRVTLGRLGRRLLAAGERASVIVLAPTQSGKTSALAVPALLEWQGPAVVTSVKSDLLRHTHAARAARAKTMVFDPTGVTGLAGVGATPLSACGSWRGAMRMAHWLASAARSGSGGLQDAEFWYAAAEKMLAPLLFAAARSSGQIADVVSWLNEGPGAEEEVARLLDEAGAEEAQSAWQATRNREERQRSSINTTAETILAAFADPRVLDASLTADYTPAELLCGEARTLYLCAPAHEQERLATLFAAMVSELIAVVYELAAQSGKPA